MRGSVQRVWVLLGALVISAQIAVVGFPLPLLPTPPARAADPPGPVPPPSPVNPAPAVQPVTTPGPTVVGRGRIDKDTVWGPQGSPYVVQNLFVAASLTLLPGTVVKLDQAATVLVAPGGQLAALGTPNQHVVITSLNDDTVFGDTNGDGTATSPTPGDWNWITISGLGTRSPQPASVFDYADVRFGGGRSDPGCRAGEVETDDGPQVRLIVSNSTFTDSTNAGVQVTGRNGTPAVNRVGIYNSAFARSGCGIAGWLPQVRADIVGNTFADSLDAATVIVSDNQETRIWFNTMLAPTVVAGSARPVGREQADVRYNALVGGIGGFASTTAVTDWSANWYGHDANQALPACMDAATAQKYNPPLRTSTSTTCPAGQVKVTGYFNPVTPALSASPLVLPAALREATAPRFGPVDTYSGALMYQTEDIVVQDAGKLLNFTRTYQSNKPGSGDAGTGWSTAYSEALSQTGGVATMQFADGRSVDFSTDPAAGYTPAPGVSADYASGPGGTTVKSPDRTSYQFDPTGQLTAMTLGDDGHSLALSRSGGKVSKITGSSGRYLAITRTAGRIDGVADQTARGVAYTYSGGRLTAARGVDGQSETYGYDSAGRLTSVTTPMGRRKLAVSYDADGRVAWLEQAGQGRTTFAYDDAHGRRTVTMADGTVLTQVYDFAGRLVEERLGSTGKHVVYDGEGRTVASITGVPAVPMTGYTAVVPATFYDRRGDAVLSVDAMGLGTATTYNSHHQPLVDTRTDLTTVNRDYDAQFRLSKVTDPLGKATTYTYNGRGQVLTRTDPMGRVTALEYAGNGDLTAMTDPSGATTRYGSDALGRRTTTTSPLGSVVTVDFTTWDQPWQVRRPRGGTTTLEFNNDRQQTAVIGPASGVTAYGYDDDGRLVSTVDALGKETKTGYDPLGRPVASTGPRGSVTKYGYTAEGWPGTVTDPNGKVTSTVFDPSGRSLRVTDPLGQVTQTAYNRSGQATDVWTPDGAHTKYGYDPMGRQTSVTNPKGNVSKIGYDANGRQVSTTDPMNYTTKVGYDDAGRVTSRTDQLSTVTSYAYDDGARSVTITDPLGTVGVVTRDADGRTKASTDGNGATTTYGYDGDGNVTGVTTPAGTATAEYDTADRLTATVDAVGRRATTGYDLLGQVTSRGYPDGSSESFGYDADGNQTSHTDRTNAVWSSTYDPANHRLTSTDPLSHTTRYGYDDLGRLTSVTDPTGVVAHTAYDPVGRPAVRWDATNASWVRQYDLDGNLIKTTDPSGLVATYWPNQRDQTTRVVWSDTTPTYLYNYDAAGRLTKKTELYDTSYEYNVRGRPTATVDGLGNRSTVAYDGAGNPVTTTTPGGHSTQYAYDTAGRLSSVTDATNNTTTFGYTAAGQLARRTLPRGGVFTYTYDNAGRLATTTDPDNGLTTYGYDGDDRPISITYPSGRLVTSAYDTAGRRTSETSGPATRNFGYDDADRLTSATTAFVGPSAAGPSLGYTYNNRGLLATATDALGTTGYEYDTAGRLSRLTPPTGVPSTFAYERHGLLSGVSGPIEPRLFYNDAAQQYAKGFAAPTRLGGYNRRYDKAGRPTDVGDIGYAATLTYNSDGLIATVTRGPEVTSYGYDDAGRVTSTSATNNGTPVADATYTWDADGNRTSVAETGKPIVTATFDQADRLTGTSDGTAYRYDTDGNRTASGDTTYTYGPFGELSAATTPNAAVTYQTDALGRTTGRTSPAGTETIGYDGLSNQIAADKQGGNPTVNLLRDRDGNLLAEAPTGTSAAAVGRDVFGNVVDVQHNDSSTARWTGAYDPFGKPTSTTGSTPTPMGYQGGYTDSVTGLVGADYDPATATNTTAHNPAGWQYPDQLQALTTLNAAMSNDFDGYLANPDGQRGTAPQPITVQLRFSTVTNTRWTTQPTSQAKQTMLGREVLPRGPIEKGTKTSPAVPAGCYQLDPMHPLAFVHCGAFVLGQTWDLVTRAWDEFTDEFSKFNAWVKDQADQVADDVCHTCTEAVHQAAQILGVSTTATVVSAVVSGAVFLGCEVLTSGIGSLGCGVAAGAAGGAVYGAMTCPENEQRWKCAVQGGVVGAVSGGAAGVATSLGASGLVTGILSGVAGDTAAQLMATGHIDPGELLRAGALGGLAGAFGSKRAATRDDASRPSRAIEETEQPATANRRSYDPTGCRHSFDPDTPVLMADGSHKPLKDVKVGDEVRTTDPVTGRSTAKTVTALFLNQDTDLADVTVRTSDGGTTVLHTTQHHPFWDRTRGGWIDAGQLRADDVLDAADGSKVIVVSVRSFTGTHAMRDLTVADLHAYYVIAGNTPVLVHNTDGDACGLVDVYRFADRTKPDDLKPAVQGEQLTRLQEVFKSHPEFKDTIANDHALHGDKTFSPFVSVALDTDSVAASSDPGLRSIVENAPDIGHFRVPVSRLYVPQNRLSQSETERLFEGEGLEDYLVGWMENPYKLG
jgi:YD repeat-containing protein